MKRHIIMKRLMPLLLFALFPGSALTVSAQQFRVESFKTLLNDVSAFITPVRDLNGDACALVKVSATDDFAFSSPLGIVKRKDDVGEVWLYLPQGSRLLTIKHPEWGVMRDYRFPKPLESHVTYELTLEMPQPKQILKRDTIVMTKVVTDTMTVGKPQIPLSVFTVLTATFGRRGPSWGCRSVFQPPLLSGVMDFKLVSEYQPTGDQPEAIAELVSSIRNHSKHNTLLGVTGSGKTFTVANVIAQLNRPTLVLSHNKTLAAQLYGEFKNFFPENVVE